MKKRLFTVILATALIMLANTDFASAKKPVPVVVRNPIVFVHGYMGWGGNWDIMIQRFMEDGYSRAELFEFNYNSIIDSNVKSAESLSNFVTGVLKETGASQVNIVAHSNGGLVTRYYIDYFGGSKLVDKFAALGSPHEGTNAAYTCIAPACFEMRPGSDFLNSLANSCDASWWSPCDEIINPDESAICGLAIQTDCIGHLAFLTDLKVYTQVRDYLAK